MEAERAEKLEAELDRITERRAREERDAAPIEEAWKDSTRRHSERRREELGAAWYDHHLRMQEVHASLASEHERRAAGLLEAGEAGS
jgi:(p)ppGpp synthase/HD superfamily hydrolase